MAGAKPAEITKGFHQEGQAKFVAYTWDLYNNQRATKVAEWLEVRDYLFATDTSSTSNAALPWKNSTTIPKLCQIRDNLHSNYISALFPNDDWLKWEAYSQEDNTRKKRDIIQAYMSNKCRQGDFHNTISRLLYDYIDYGNAFATVSFQNAITETEGGEARTRYVGPRIHRISPMDIVFNPTASSFEESFKIIRSIKSLGEIASEVEDFTDNEPLQKALQARSDFVNRAGSIGADDFNKAVGIVVDGFGSYYDYLMSGFVEILDFYGDYFDQNTGILHRNRHITVIDRTTVIRNQDIPSWLGMAPIYHVGWRLRPDNLWAMGPLDNLVGLQYRLDHLENLKADAMDLAVLPPLKIIGDVEEFEWRPGVEIHIDAEGSDVQELGKNAQWVIQAESDMQVIEARMEMYAGAPREAMGIRTPGEKTAFEVQQLQNASGRIFQEKINQFEQQLLEKLLNAGLEVARRNMDGSDVVRVLDDDLGASSFTEITKEDITASGVLRPIGARHFAAQAMLIQNLTGTFNSNMYGVIAPHVSSIGLAKLWADAMGLTRYNIVQNNIAIAEQQETMQMQNIAQEEMMYQDSKAQEML